MRTLRSSFVLASGLAMLACVMAAGFAVAGGDLPGGKPKVQEARADDSAPRYSASGYDITPLSAERREALVARLSPEQRVVTQQCGTERPFTGALLKNDKAGVYCCVVCDLPLFRSAHKFDSRTGWPSYHTPYDPAHIGEKEDRSYGMVRTENVCARCDAHLGHVFSDGPPPTGLRYCINSAALVFYAEGEERPRSSLPVETRTAYFAAGCFWGIEHYFAKGPGVLRAVSGYMQGELEEPTYQQVISGRTGHAETVKVVYDPNRITYRRLLEAFFTMHDPTQLNRQGPDVGTQYRSGIWAADEEQLREAQAFVAELNAKGRYAPRAIVTQIEPAKTFWRAEDYHQGYIARTGRRCATPNPW